MISLIRSQTCQLGAPQIGDLIQALLHLLDALRLDQVFEGGAVETFWSGYFRYSSRNRHGSFWSDSRSITASSSLDCRSPTLMPFFTIWR